MQLLWLLSSHNPWNHRTIWHIQQMLYRKRASWRSPAKRRAWFRDSSQTFWNNWIGRLASRTRWLQRRMLAMCISWIPKITISPSTVKAIINIALEYKRLAAERGMPHICRYWIIRMATFFKRHQLRWIRNQPWRFRNRFYNQRRIRISLKRFPRKWP